MITSKIKKGLAIASLVLMGNSSVSAMDTQYFVAAGVGSGSMDVNADAVIISTGATGSTSVSDSGGVFSLQGGVVLDDNHRIGLDYTTFNVDGGSMSSIGLGYDYRFIIDKNWKPFVGASYVVNNYKEDLDTSVYNSSSFSLSTNVLFARIGVDYEIDDNFLITASYDYSITTSGDETTTGNISGEDFKATLEIDKISLFRVLVGYKF